MKSFYIFDGEKFQTEIFCLFSKVDYDYSSFIIPKSGLVTKQIDVLKYCKLTSKPTVLIFVYNV